VRGGVEWVRRNPNGFARRSFMNWKNKIWKYVTACVVLLIVLNPEMAQLAFFIDAVGLEVFLMLLEVQFLAFLGLFFGAALKPILSYIISSHSQRFPLFSWEAIRELPRYFIQAVPPPVFLMNMLVVMVSVGIIFDVH
jgi:hypothetical protein